MSLLRYPFLRPRRRTNNITFKGIAACLVPIEWRFWLCDTGSLTQRLTHISHGDFQVVVLRQQHAAARVSELRRLDLAPRCLPLVREVLLLCRGEPWVYARSIIPRATEVGAGRHLTRLGTRPLGAALFKDPSVQRGTIWLRHERINNPLPDSTAGCWPTSAATVATEPGPAEPGPAAPACNLPTDTWPDQCLWGRQCVFHIGNAPILVSEYFLPPCNEYSLQRLALGVDQ